MTMKLYWKEWKKSEKKKFERHDVVDRQVRHLYIGVPLIATDRYAASIHHVVT